MLERLDVPELLHGAASARDAEDARSYQRILELLFARTSFYEPRQYLKEGDLVLAGLHAQLDELDEAMEWLECYAGSPGASAAVLESDTLLAPLGDQPGFRRVLERLGEGR